MKELNSDFEDTLRNKNQMMEFLLDEEDRLPIKTYVSEFSDDLIREAILRELDREGQVYFLHNRVHDIEYMSN